STGIEDRAQSDLLGSKIGLENIATADTAQAKSSKPWEALGMSRALWYRLGKPDQSTYTRRHISRHRRTKAAIRSVHDTIKELLEESHPQTVRQVFYALTVRGVIAKQEVEYKRTAVRLLGQMREAGEIP